MIEFLNFVQKKGNDYLMLNVFVTLIHFLFINRRLAFLQCYFVNDASFCTYIKQWIFPELITSFDLSHCYWISAEILLNAISSMNQLETLSIEDTRLNLVHISKIFESCHHITTIGISLVEENWNNFELSLGSDLSTTLETLSKGFEKLKSLKILAFNAAYYIDSWLVILPLLRYLIYKIKT